MFEKAGRQRGFDAGEGEDFLLLFHGRHLERRRGYLLCGSGGVFVFGRGELGKRLLFFRFLFLLFLRLSVLALGVEFELILVHREAEPHQHDHGGDDYGRAYRVEAVEHHEHIEVELREHGQDDGHDIAHRVRDIAEFVGVEVGHERQGGAAVSRHSAIIRQIKYGTK